MSTRVIPKATTVRATFEKSLANRVEHLVDISTKKIDTQLRSHFDKALARGEEPYPPPYYQIDLLVLEEKDFASGNNPEAGNAFANLAPGTPDGDKLTKTITQILSDAGFAASVTIDPHQKQLRVNVSDPQFTQWAQYNNVDTSAQQQVQETLAQRQQKANEERAKAIVPGLNTLVKNQIRDMFDQGHNGNMSFYVNANLGVDYQVMSAACDVVSKQLSTKATTVQVAAQSEQQAYVSISFNSDNAVRAYKRSLES